MPRGMPWDPFEFLGDEFGEGFPMHPDFEQIFKGMHFSPAVNVKESDSDVIIMVKLPGAKPKDIHVQIYDTGLTVSGKISSETKKEEEGYYRLERSSGSFTRSIGFPCEVDKKGAKAVFEQGVLIITVPKKVKGKMEGLPLKILELKKAREYEASHTVGDGKGKKKEKPSKKKKPTKKSAKKKPVKHKKKKDGK